MSYLCVQCLVSTSLWCVLLFFLDDTHYIPTDFHRDLGVNKVHEESLAHKVKVANRDQEETVVNKDLQDLLVMQDPLDLLVSLDLRANLENKDHAVNKV